MLCSFTLIWLRLYPLFKSRVLGLSSTWLLLHRTLTPTCAFYTWNLVTFVVTTYLILFPMSSAIETFISHPSTLSSPCPFSVRSEAPDHKTIFCSKNLPMGVVMSDTYSSDIASMLCFVKHYRFEPCSSCLPDSIIQLVISSWPRSNSLNHFFNTPTSSPPPILSTFVNYSAVYFTTTTAFVC